ncbi:RNA-binding (RRM/RBD/RNP motifs) family protein [Striga asiatica]|uniref:RNA-binding (RRM/RBD/RNP motifs) family protein n=1 Tax=Striga asiatica TaxID=4170 RepID=A0A5A7R2A3_STRAF|nr:RNA-binding (RRM/RBD/RNP motifs) family protein [Striga asiatica]
MPASLSAARRSTALPSSNSAFSIGRLSYSPPGVRNRQEIRGTYLTARKWNQSRLLQDSFDLTKRLASRKQGPIDIELSLESKKRYPRRLRYFYGTLSKGNRGGFDSIRRKQRQLVHLFIGSPVNQTSWIQNLNEGWQREGSLMNYWQGWISEFETGALQLFRNEVLFAMELPSALKEEGESNGRGKGKESN